MKARAEHITNKKEWSAVSNETEFWSDESLEISIWLSNMEPIGELGKSSSSGIERGEAELKPIEKWMRDEDAETLSINNFLDIAKFDC